MMLRILLNVDINHDGDRHCEHCEGNAIVKDTRIPPIPSSLEGKVKSPLSQIIDCLHRRSYDNEEELTCLVWSGGVYRNPSQLKTILSISKKVSWSSGEEFVN